VDVVSILYATGLLALSAVMCLWCVYLSSFQYDPDEFDLSGRGTAFSFLLAIVLPVVTLGGYDRVHPVASWTAIAGMATAILVFAVVVFRYEKGRVTLPRRDLFRRWFMTVERT
jgi:hypothetical protein